MILSEKRGENNMKRVIAAGLTVILLLCVLAGNSILRALEGKEISSGFSGSRCVTYNADKSDLDNFIDGGRAVMAELRAIF